MFPRVGKYATRCSRVSVPPPPRPNLTLWVNCSVSPRRLFWQLLLLAGFGRDDFHLARRTLPLALGMERGRRSSGAVRNGTCWQTGTVRRARCPCRPDGTPRSDGPDFQAVFDAEKPQKIQRRRHHVDRRRRGNRREQPMIIKNARHLTLQNTTS